MIRMSVLSVLTKIKLYNDWAKNEWKGSKCPKKNFKGPSESLALEMM